MSLRPSRIFASSPVGENNAVNSQIKSEVVACPYCFIKYSERKAKKQEIQKNFCIKSIKPQNAIVVFEMPDGNQEMYIQWNVEYLGYIVKTLPKYNFNKK